ncbi:glycoside hydrolase superfamily [Aspergillus spectabilis]
MTVLRRILGLLAGLAMLESVYAGLDLSSNSTVAVYWGQNSYRGTGNLAQQRLGYYCTPEIDFSTASEKCDTFNGTNLKNCPEIGEDITKCQSKGKTILLSIGGATYSEGGLTSESAAESSADLLWATFGPDKGDAKVYRPFGKAVLDGFDFDFEAAVTNTGTLATRLRTVMDADKSKKYFLTAAPQCPFPDAADKDILNTDSSAAIDAVFVQFYNNFCGVNAYTPSSGSSTPSPGASVGNFNLATWDKWALTESKNKHVRVFLGVPANTGAASTGYLPVGSLEPVIAYSKGFESFGGVMMWDVTQAYGNQGFLDGVKKALGKQEQHTPQLSPQVTATTASASTATATATVAKPQESQVQPAAASPAGPAQQGTQAEEQQQNQDQGDDQFGSLNLLPSLLEPDDDLDWVQI